MKAPPWLDDLKRYFAGRPDASFAFLFGSWVKGRANGLSDVDVAVYFRPEQRRPLEYEAEIFYAGEAEVQNDMERLLKREVELLVLNRAPATVASSAIRGIPLAVNDWGLYLDFMETVTGEGQDYEELLIDDFRSRAGSEKGM
ncbi:MAG: nucleotidyltransferase domain-containing protein [Candidatus Edwardsbacteria bacterium]|nr:nucleotidyltransferase domain-containing protein [Candidatus Edwardsbacteria bacterium]